MKTVLFSPKVEPVVVAAGDTLKNNIASCFALLKHNPQNETLWHRLNGHILYAANMVTQSAYDTGCRDFGVQPNQLDKTALRRWAKEWTLFAGNEIRQWTLEELGLTKNIQSAKSKKYLLGKDRSKVIVSNNLWTGYFKGKKKAMAWVRAMTNERLRKEWLTSAAHDRDDICDQNEDDGVIDIGDMFASGDDMPPAHIYCECTVRIIRG